VFTVGKNTQFMVMVDVCSITGQSPAEFRRTWIDTHFATAHQFANQVLITRPEVEKIKEAWKDAATANVIAQKLGRERYLCENLKKMGRLSPQYTLGKGNKKVHLYPRNDPSLAHFAIKR